MGATAVEVTGRMVREDLGRDGIENSKGEGRREEGIGVAEEIVRGTIEVGVLEA